MSYFFLLVASLIVRMLYTERASIAGDSLHNDTPILVNAITTKMNRINGWVVFKMKASLPGYSVLGSRQAKASGICIKSAYCHPITSIIGMMILGSRIRDKYIKINMFEMVPITNVIQLTFSLIHIYSVSS